MSASQGSVLDVLTRTLQQATGLVSTLGQLAAAEVGESVGSAVKGVVALLAGLFVAMIGLLFLLHAAVAGLVLRGWSEALSYLIVGGATIVLGAVALGVGVMFLRGASPVPRRTMREVRALIGQETQSG